MPLFSLIVVPILIFFESFLFKKIYIKILKCLETSGIIYNFKQYISAVQEIHLHTIKHTQFEGVGKALSQSPRVSS